MNELLHKYSSGNEQVTALVKRIIPALQQGIAERGYGTMAVSGGGTPKPLFEALSQIDLDWSKVKITLADDRWVDSDHDSSNEKLVNETLLKDKASLAEFVGLKTADEKAVDGEQECSNKLHEFRQGFDVVLLGMGDDGHTASLFPCADKARLKQAMDLENQDLCQAIEPTTAPFERMTLTANALLNSRFTALMVKGQSKLDTIEKALSDQDVFAMPIRLFIHKDAHPTAKPAEIFWAS